MYHFTADHAPDPLRLSFREIIPGHVRQYLKDFQVEAIRYLHTFVAKSEFCVYNDESGLGKQAAVVVLLDAACNSRKCLIVVQNDDRYVNGWEFHINVLTNSNATVIKNEKDATDSFHNISIAKWSTLRTIDDLSKFKFDFIILDNRGQMLNNSFCTSMLLKHYERKINILISSVDITSDLKLLHNVLRLGGRLEPQYTSFKIFEEKFKLPDAKELAYKRVVLEDYFCKRERLSDYCKAFRLRRYCHQFETQLPLVNEDRYSINIGLWREKQNATTSESSSIEYLNNKNSEDEQLKDTQELFEEYCRQRRKQHLQFQQEEEKRLHERELEMLKSVGSEKEIVYNVDDEIALINDTPPLTTENLTAPRNNSDDPILMSPLMVESDSEPDDIPEICNNIIEHIEVVDLSSEEKEEICKANKEENATSKTTKEAKKLATSKSCASGETSLKRRLKKRTELDMLVEDIVDTLKIKKLPKRISRDGKSEVKRITRTATSDSKRLTANKSTSLVNAGRESISSKNIKSLKKISENHKEKRQKLKRKYAVPETANKVIDNKTTRNNNPVEEENVMQNDINKNIVDNTSTSLTLRKTRSLKNSNTVSKNQSNQVPVKQEIPEKTANAKKNVSKDIQVKSSEEKCRLKRESKVLPAGIHNKQTRSMQRLTRSVGGNKYFRRNLSLQIDNVNKVKKRSSLKMTLKSEKKNKNKDINKVLPIKDKTAINLKNTQASIISNRSSQEYEPLQCAQRLSDTSIFYNGIDKSTEFLVPSTPISILKNSLIPSSLTSSTGFLTESDVTYIPLLNHSKTANKKQDEVIWLLSSENENSISQSSSTYVAMTSRRTRALKPKRSQQQATGEESKIPNFSDLLIKASARSSAKSPDLFSNCSDLVQLPCTQLNLGNDEPNTPFDGFKIFGSDIKQLQQQYAFNKNNTNKHNISLRNSYQGQRSCLDILEKMFEPSNKKLKQQSNEKSHTYNKKSNRADPSTSKEKSHTQVLPSHPIEVVTEAQQQQKILTRKCAFTLPDDDIFEITNNGTFGSVMRLHSNGDLSPIQNMQRATTKQHNKITNYLIGNVIQNGSQDEIPPNSGQSTCNLHLEAGTLCKTNQQLSTVHSTNAKKSPKGKGNTAQATKLTKWFTKPSELNGIESTVIKPKLPNTKKATIKQMPSNQEFVQNVKNLPSSSLPARGKRIARRRRLDLSFNK